MEDVRLEWMVLERTGVDWVEHELPLPVGLCPVSGNPGPGSLVRIGYAPGCRVIRVESIGPFLESMRAGRMGARTMEGLVALVAERAAVTLGVTVRVEAEVWLAGVGGEMLRIAARGVR